MPRLLIVEPSWFTLRHGLFGIARFLLSHGFEVAIASEDDTRARSAAKELGAQFYPIAISRHPSPQRDLSAIFSLSDIVRNFRPTVLQASTKKGGLLAGVVGRLHKVPTVYLLRGLIRDGASPNWIFKFVERINAMLATKVLVISQSNLSHFLDNRICSPEKLIMFGSGSLEGVDTERFARTERSEAAGSTLRRKLGIPPEAFVVGFVGRLVLEKGIRELTSAWASVSSCDGRPHFLIVSPPEIGPGAEQYVDRLRSASNVHFTGFLQDPTPAYASMNCLVLPSYSEGFPSVLLEAACFELPVIATRVSGCVDAVAENQTGWLIEPRDERALANCIMRVLKETHTVNEMGRNARLRAVAEFSQESLWSQYAHLYASL